MKVKQTWKIDKKDARFRELSDEDICELVVKNLSMGIIYIYDEESVESLNKGPLCRLVTTKAKLIP